MKRILVSACLLGVPCRYDGSGAVREELRGLAAEEGIQLIPVCPEQLGGLPTPRPPAERVGDRVMTRSGEDVTAEYRRGAERTAELARLFGCTGALLKARSPSCGSGSIYDGTFSGTRAPGDGMTVQMLKAEELMIFDEEHWPDFLRWLGKETQK